VLRAVIDTHAIIWYLYADTRLSTVARTTIEQIASGGHQITFSSITLAEIVYLSERGRINIETLERLLAETNRNDALFVETPFDRRIAQTLKQVKRSSVPELPDRIIAATAVYWELSIISRDSKIQLSGLSTIW